MDGYEDTLAHFAAVRGKACLVFHLITQYNAEVTQKVLDALAISGETRQLEQLAATRPLHFNTSIMYSVVRAQRIEMLRWLFNYGIPWLRPDETIIAAVTGRSLEVLRFVLDNGCLRNNRPPDVDLAIMRRAIDQGSVDTLALLMSRGLRAENEGLWMTAIKRKDPDILRYLAKNYPTAMPRAEGIVRYAINLRRLDAMEIVVELGAPISDGAIKMALEVEPELQVPYFNFLLEYKVAFTTSHIVDAARAGNLLALKRMSRDSALSPWSFAVLEAAMESSNRQALEFVRARVEITDYLPPLKMANIGSDRPDYLKHLLSLGFWVDEYLMKEAAAGGHLRILRYLHEEHGMPWALHVSDAAVEGGHLHVIRYLIESDAPLRPSHLVRKAVKLDARRVVRLLVKTFPNTLCDAVVAAYMRDNYTLVDHLLRCGGNSFPINLDVELARNGLTLALAHAIGKGLSVTPRSIDAAVYYNHLETVKFLFARTKKMTANTVVTAVSRGSYNCLEFALNNGAKLPPVADIPLVNPSPEHVRCRQLLRQVYFRRHQGPG